jgi:PAS domain S-box-containing protein
MDNNTGNHTEFEEYLINILNYIADPVFVKDDKFCFITVNDSFCKMLGMERENILGKTLGESLPADQMEHFLEVDKIVLESGQENLSEEPLTGKDNKVLTIVTKKTRYIDRSGKKYIVGVIRDITERKKLEILLSKEKKEQEILLDSLPAWVFYKDGENNFIRVNQAFADAMKLSKDKLEGKSLFDIYPREQAEQFLKDDKEVMTSGKPKTNIIESIESSDATVWLQTDKIPYRDNEGKIIGVIGFSLIITERKLAEEKLKEKVDEFEKMNKFLVDREIKMVELKDEIAKLKYPE